MPNFLPEVVPNYVTNVDEILNHIKQFGKFTRRHPGDKTQHKAKINGSVSKFSTWYSKDISQDTINTIWKTIPEDKKHCTQMVINRYEPGDFLVKHCDAQGGYWKFKLIFLTDGKPHFCWYDKQDQAHLVQESKGALFNMDIGLYHEVTQLTANEPNKYSLCLIYE